MANYKNKDIIKNDKNNIILVGMPSSGKSTIGSILAQKLNMNFIDTDYLIRESQKMDLKDIVNAFGHEHFLKIQENEILRLNAENSIIATGGSVIYGKKSMTYLKNMGNIVYLMLSIEELAARIASGRRFAKNAGQSFTELYYERVPLYEKYSDIIVNCSNKEIDVIVNEIILCIGTLFNVKGIPIT